MENRALETFYRFKVLIFQCFLESNANFLTGKSGSGNKMKDLQMICFQCFMWVMGGRNYFQKSVKKDLLGSREESFIDDVKAGIA